MACGPSPPRANTTQRLAAACWAFTLEGPYMSTEDGPRGAHPLAHCRRPNWDEFSRLQEAAGGRIVILTMSAEFEEAPDFIARATASGVVVSIGHTAASGAQIRAAVDAGAKLSTHLGNGAHRTLRRHPNYLWDQLAEDRLMASIIADGHHLPPEVVKTIVRAKSPLRTILVSDESGLAGLPPGRYQCSGCELEILSDGRLVIAGQDQLLAGASRPIGDGVVNVMRFAGVDLATAVADGDAQSAGASRPCRRQFTSRRSGRPGAVRFGDRQQRADSTSHDRRWPGSFRPTVGAELTRQPAASASRGSSRSPAR